MKQILLFLVAVMLLSSCENKEKIAQYEKERAELELQKAQLEKDKEGLKVQISLLERSLEEQKSENERNLKEQERLRKEQEDQRMRSILSETWQRYGAVKLYAVKEDPWDNYKEKIEETGEGGVYVKHSSYGDQYELRYTLNNKSYSYVVSRGTFTLRANGKVMQFSAHAGEYYFDL